MMYRWFLQQCGQAEAAKQSSLALVLDAEHVLYPIYRLIKMCV
jgi:hypothetical protein